MTYTWLSIQVKENHQSRSDGTPFNQEITGGLHQNPNRNPPLNSHGIKNMLTNRFPGSDRQLPIDYFMRKSQTKFLKIFLRLVFKMICHQYHCNQCLKAVLDHLHSFWKSCEGYYHRQLIRYCWIRYQGKRSTRTQLRISCVGDTLNTPHNLGKLWTIL